MMRKLATLRRVADVQPIPGADKIELAKIDGWQCVVKKGELKPGSLALYCEIDSFLPANDERFAFLSKDFRNDHEGRRGARLRTIKLRGMLSQGLALGLEQFPELAHANEGEDLTDALGIVKWEPPMPAQLSGVARGSFPAFLRKTDQERIQNVPHYLDDAGNYEVTIKLDGSSMTAYHYEGNGGVCSRNLDLVETEGNTFWSVARTYGLPMRLAKLCEEMNIPGIAIQGELMGPNIQGNRERLGTHDLFVFDVLFPGEQRYATPGERYDICRLLGLKHVPVVSYETTLPVSVEEALSLAEGRSLNPDVTREGVVFKRLDGCRSFKAIANSYLLSE